VSSVRILLASASSRTRELIRELVSGEDDFELVGEFENPLQVLLGVKENRADVVVVDAEHLDASGIETHLLAEYPSLVILGRVREVEFFIEQLCPARSRLRSNRLNDVAEALRRAVRTPCS
jgi:AmiR/NasT family two-component response regulator